jgi:hypothetical protein
MEGTQATLPSPPTASPIGERWQFSVVAPGRTWVNTGRPYASAWVARWIFDSVGTGVYQVLSVNDGEVILGIASEHRPIARWKRL